MTKMTEQHLATTTFPLNHRQAEQIPVSPVSRGWSNFVAATSDKRVHQTPYPSAAYDLLSVDDIVNKEPFSAFTPDEHRVIWEETYLDVKKTLREAGAQLGKNPTTNESLPVQAVALSIMVSDWKLDDEVTMDELLIALMALDNILSRKDMTVGEVAHVLSVARRQFFAHIAAEVFPLGLDKTKPLMMSAQRVWWSSAGSDNVLWWMKDDRYPEQAILWTWLASYLYPKNPKQDKSGTAEGIRLSVSDLRTIPLHEVVPYIKAGVDDGDLIRQAISGGVDPDVTLAVARA